jgi:hypothetical protein
MNTEENNTQFTQSSVSDSASRLLKISLRRQFFIQI